MDAAEHNVLPLRSAPRATGVATIGLQPASLDIWDSKYRLKTKTGEPIDAEIDDTYRRVARTLADIEATPEAREHWYGRFCEALRRGAIPAGRIISNAGAREHKPATSTINCTVSAVVRDSMDDILRKVHEAGLTLKAGCGIGYEFSTLRPRGAWVSGAGAQTSGPLSFMDIYDAMCFTVVFGRRAARRADGDVRRGASRRDGVHPGEARERAPASVQPLAPHHPGVRGRGPQRPSLEARLPDVGERAGASRSRRPRAGRVAALARPLRKLHPRQGWARRLPRLPDAPRPPDVGRDHVLDVRLRRAGVRPDRRNQRDEQQLVLRGDPRHQSMRDRRHLGADLRGAPAGGGPRRPSVRRGRRRHRSCHRRARLLPDRNEGRRLPRDRGWLSPDPHPRPSRSPGGGKPPATR